MLNNFKWQKLSLHYKSKLKDIDNYLASSLGKSPNSSQHTNETTVDNTLLNIQNRIDELKEQKKISRELIERAVDVICIIDTNGKIISINKAVKKSWGYKPEDLTNKNIIDYIAENYREQFLTKMLGEMQKSIEKIVFDSRIIHSNGQYLDVTWTGHWSATEGRLFSIIHDISEQKRLEKMRKEFIAMIAHDIRAPLGSVQASLQLMELGVLGTLSAKGIEVAETTRKQCANLLLLLDDMLQMEKIESEQFLLNKKDVDIKDLAAEAINTLKPMAQEKDIVLELDAITCICLVDELRILQVLWNLIGNAIKNSPSNKSSQVLISITKENSFCKVSVIDKGCGIAQEKLEKIFDKYEQDLNSTKTAYTQTTDKNSRTKIGVGLGLAISKALIQKHGGQIGVNSTINEGSTFWFSLPITQ